MLLKVTSPLIFYPAVAQTVEHTTEARGVGGAIPPGGT
jgi:hypothetical protein